MGERSPSLKHLATILYRPRETFRAILDGDARRWTPEIVILAAVCLSAVDTDTREVHQALPSLSLGTTLALMVLLLAATAAGWVLLLYIAAPVVTLCGRWLGGEAPIRDVRAALAWGVVPLIWSLPLRIAVAMNRPPVRLAEREHARIAFDFMVNGGCTAAILIATVQLMFDAWVLYVMSSCVAEALRVPSWKGFGSLVMTAAVPVVIAVAAVLAFKS